MDYETLMNLVIQEIMLDIDMLQLDLTKVLNSSIKTKKQITLIKKILDKITTKEASLAKFKSLTNNSENKNNK